MFWFHEFDFLAVAYLLGGILKYGIPESEQCCIGKSTFFNIIGTLHIFDIKP